MRMDASLADKLQSAKDNQPQTEMRLVDATLLQEAINALRQLEAQVLKDLEFGVEYRRKDGGHGWKLMAAFDSGLAAKAYSEEQRTDDPWPWVYRTVSLSSTNRQSTES